MDMETDSLAEQWSLASDAGIGGGSVDTERYISPYVYSAECERIFRRAWLLVGRESEIPEPGDYIVREIFPLKIEAIIVRGRDNRVQAFHNACAHRGAALVNGCKGRTNLFVCPYHAWSYGTDGKCRAIPGAEYFPQLDRQDVGLTPIHVDVWNGFLFLNLDERPQQSLAEFLGVLGESFADVPFHEMRHGVELVHDLETNWKCLLDAFCESYHVRVLHRQSIPMLPTPTNPHANYYDASFTPPHCSYVVQSNPDWVPPGDVTRFVYSAAANLQLRAPEQGASGQSATRLIDHTAINPLGLRQFGLRVLNIFPCTQIYIFRDHYQLQQYWPKGPGKCQFALRIYTRSAPQSYFERFAEAFGLAGIRDVLTEDVSMTERQQAVLRSGALKRLHFGENEVAVRFVHQMIQDWLGSEVTGRAEAQATVGTYAESC